MPASLPRKLARHYNLPLQVSSIFALLVLSDGVTNESVFESLGTVETRALIFRLRKVLDKHDIKIHSRRSVGYWLDDETRRSLASNFGVELGISI